ncbi:hypothetical protein N7513_003913 [Penicillium frequentans]|nr:hypothetical protein N7513_003913 [Penicillium glabrum]
MGVDEAEKLPTWLDAEALKKAVDEALKTEPRQLIRKDEITKKRRFITQTQGYFVCVMVSDIQAYIFTGIQMPRTVKIFDEEIPPSTFEKLRELDPTIHQDTRKVVVAVSESCNSFKEKTLGQLWSSPQIAIDYSKEAIKQLYGNSFSLERLWDTLTDRKYGTEETWDADFQDACIGARGVLQNLQKLADTGHQEMVDLINKMKAVSFPSHPMVNFNKTRKEVNINSPGGVQFYQDTLLRQRDVIDIRDRYERRSVTKGEMETVQRELAKEAKEMAEGAGEMLTGTISSINGPFGIFFSLHGAHRCKNADKKWKVAGAKFLDKEGAKKEVIRLIEVVTALCLQFSDLLKSMEAAISAMMEVSNLLVSQRGNFKAIQTAIQLMQDGVNSSASMFRRMNVQDGIKNAVESFAQVEGLAQELMDTCQRFEKNVAYASSHQ